MTILHESLPKLCQRSQICQLVSVICHKLQNKRLFYPQIHNILQDYFAISKKSSIFAISYVTNNKSFMKQFAFIGKLLYGLKVPQKL